MKLFAIIVPIILMLSLSNSVIAKQDRATQQKEMDAACEVAREDKLAPLRQQYVEECVQQKQQPDRAACERFYSDYGARSGDRLPLFYELPECEAAFDYRNSYRRSK